jgi:hypothetical protein
MSFPRDEQTTRFDVHKPNIVQILKMTSLTSKLNYFTQQLFMHTFIHFFDQKMHKDPLVQLFCRRDAHKASHPFPPRFHLLRPSFYTDNKKKVHVNSKTKTKKKQQTNEEQRKQDDSRGSQEEKKEEPARTRAEPTQKNPQASRQRPNATKISTKKK